MLLTPLVHDADFSRATKKMRDFRASTIGLRHVEDRINEYMCGRLFHRAHEYALKPKEAARMIPRNFFFAPEMN